MAIYLIENDGFRFQELDLHINDFIENFPDAMDMASVHDFSKNNLALTAYWKKLRTGFSIIEGGENLLPDVSCWIGATLLLSPKANRLLKDLLDSYGEFLPILIGEHVYYIFNCLTVCDAEGNGIFDFSFDSSSIKDKVVFKPQSKFDTSLFCSDYLKDAIESFELHGVVFEYWKN